MLDAEEEVSSRHQGDQKRTDEDRNTALVNDTAEACTVIETSKTPKDSLKSVVRITHL